MRTSLAILAAALALAGCGKSPEQGAKRTEVKFESSDAQAELNPSGRPEAPLIDPQLKTVTVLAPPSAPQLLAKQEAGIVAERDKVEAQLHDLMDGYSTNMRDPASRAKYQEQIAQQLDTYKRHTLQLYKLQRRNELAKTGQGPAAQPD
jgi:hypothetical protein